MSKLSSLRRNLDPRRVYIAQETQKKKIELAKKFVEERVAKDAEFARDVIKAVGDKLPQNIKEIAEATIKADNLKPIVGGDTTSELVPILTDGGEEILVHPTELPDYPRDGEKLIQEEGPKVEKI